MRHHNLTELSGCFDEARAQLDEARDQLQGLEGMIEHIRRLAIFEQGACRLAVERVNRELAELTAKRSQGGGQ